MASFISLLVMVSISSWELEDYAISVLPVGALLASLITLMPMSTQSRRVQRSASVSDWSTRLSWRTAAVLLVPSVADVATFGVPAVSLGRFLTLTIARALTWLLMSYMVYYQGFTGCYSTNHRIGTVFFLVHRDGFGNVCHHCELASIHPCVRNPVATTCDCLCSCPRTGHLPFAHGSEI